MPDLQRLTENAVIAWLNASGTHSQTLGITPANSSSDDAASLPRIVVKCTPRAERIPGTGVYDVECEVAYLWQADDTTDAAASTLWAKIKAIMLWDALAARISDAANLTCWGAVWSDGNESHELEDRHHRQTLTLTLVCQPS
jgi:hypothetical protein